MLTRYPGFIDVHVHLRDPGAIHKEDFGSGSRAALAGGFTFVIDMPNNPVPTVSPERLEEKIHLAQEKALCGIGFHYGTDGNNLATFLLAWKNPRVFGLKIYCNHTTGTLLIEDRTTIERIFKAWESEKPILVHAEGEQLVMAIELANAYKRRLHVCHISQKTEVQAVRTAKKEHISVSAGVTPHHLFLTDGDRTRLGSFAIMKPPLGDRQDQDALWEGLLDGTIDLVETDHAPHTKDEKKADKPPFGVPGLETAAGLLFKAAHGGKIPIDLVKILLFERPGEIFHIPIQRDTYIELDPEAAYTIGVGGYKSKCGWSPFEGWEVYGKVINVMVQGNVVVRASKLIC